MIIKENIDYPSTYVVWDLETTGLDPVKDKILEVGCMVVLRGQVAKSYSLLLNHNIDIPEAASNIHGITRELCEKEGNDPDSVIKKLVEILKTASCNVTHNGTKFDIPFLLEAYIQTNPTISEVESFSRHLKSSSIDTAGLFKARKLGLTRAWNEPLYNFSMRTLNTKAYGLKFNIPTCCEDLQINTDGIIAHRTAGDIQMTNEIYQKLIIQ